MPLIIELLNGSDCKLRDCPDGSHRYCSINADSETHKDYLPNGYTTVLDASEGLNHSLVPGYVPDEGKTALSRRKRDLLFPSGVKLCSHETVQQAIQNHLNYFHLRVCQETIWEAFKIFWDRLPEKEEYQIWMRKCQNSSVSVFDIGRSFSQSPEHLALISSRVGVASVTSTSAPTSPWQPECRHQTTTTAPTQANVATTQQVSILVPEGVPDSQDITPQIAADPILTATIAADLQMTLGITPEPDLITAFEDLAGMSTSSPIELKSVATGKPISETELEVELDAIEHPVETLNITVQHEEVEIVSESKLITSDRTPEESTSRTYDYEIPTTFEDLLGISITFPTVVTSGPVRTAGVTIQHEANVVSESTLSTNDRTPEDYTSKQYEHDISTTLEDSPEISTNTPTVIISEITEELHSESEPEVGQDVTQGLGKTSSVTIQYEEVDIVSESTSMTTDRALEEHTSKKYEHDIPTTLEDSPGIRINTPTVIISEFTEETHSESEPEVGQDAPQDLDKTASVNIQHEEVGIVSESTLLTTDRTLEEHTSKKYEHNIPTTLEDSPGISTNTPTVIISEFTEETYSESEPEVGQDDPQDFGKTASVTIQHEEVGIVSESTLMTTDRTLEEHTSKKYEHKIPTTLEDSPGISTNTPTVIFSEFTEGIYSESEPKVEQVATQGLDKMAGVTIQHEEVGVVSDSTLMTTDRTLEEHTSKKIEHNIPSTLEESLGISTNTPTVIISEFTKETYSESEPKVGQDAPQGLGKTASVTIQHEEVGIVSESTLLTTDRTLEEHTSKKYEHNIPTTLEDSPGISTSTPTVIFNEFTEGIYSESEPEVEQVATQGLDKIAGVTIQHEKVDAISKSTLMTTDRTPEDSTLGKHKYIIPTYFEDSLIITSSELTNEATVKQDVTEGSVETSYVTIPHESTLTTSARNPEDSTSGKYDFPTVFEDSLGISTNNPTEIIRESTQEIISVTNLYMGQGVTEGHVKSVDATPVGSIDLETDLPTSLGDSPAISTNTPAGVTRESIENLISETGVEDGLGVTESPVKSVLVTIQHVDVSEAIVISTDKPPVDTLTEISPVQSVLPEEPVETTTTELREVSPNPPTEVLPKAKADKDVITHVTTVPGILSPTTRVNTSPGVVSTEDGLEDIAIVTLLDKDEEKKAPYTKPTPEVNTGEELPGTMTESTHEVSKETHESLDDSPDAEEDHLGTEEDIITETPEVVEVTAGETTRWTQETTEATESVFTEKDKHVDEDITAIGKPGEMTTEATEVPEIDFEDIGTETVTVLENTPEDLGDVTEAVILEESSQERPVETSTNTTSQTTSGITSKATLDTSFDIDTPENDIVEFVGMEDKVEGTTKTDEGGEETFKEAPMPGLTVTELEKDILTTIINEDIREVTEPSTILEDTHKVAVEITHEVTGAHETKGDFLSKTPEVPTETPKVITEADVITETPPHVISQAPKVISQAPVETSGSEVTSQTPLSISKLSEVPKTAPKTPDIHMVQPEPAENDIPTPILKVEDITVVLNDLSTTIQKTFSTTLQNLPQDISNDILDENSMIGNEIDDIIVRPVRPVGNHTVKLSIKIRDKTYDNALRDKSSYYYQHLSELFIDKIEEVFKRLPGFKKIDVLDFSPQKDIEGGLAVVVHYAVVLEGDIAGISNETMDYINLNSNMVENSFTDPEEQPIVTYTITDFQNYINEVFQQHNFIRNTTLEVDPESLQLENVETLLPSKPTSRPLDSSDMMDNVLASEKPPDVPRQELSNNDIFIDDFHDEVYTIDPWMNGQSEDKNANDVIIFEESPALSPEDVSLKNFDIEFTSKFETTSSAPASGTENDGILEEEGFLQTATTVSPITGTINEDALFTESPHKLEETPVSPVEPPDVELTIQSDLIDLGSGSGFSGDHLGPDIWPWESETPEVVTNQVHQPQEDQESIVEQLEPPHQDLIPEEPFLDRVLVTQDIRTNPHYTTTDQAPVFWTMETLTVELSMQTQVAPEEYDDYFSDEFTTMVTHVTSPPLLHVYTSAEIQNVDASQSPDTKSSPADKDYTERLVTPTVIPPSTTSSTEHKQRAAENSVTEGITELPALWPEVDGSDEKVKILDEKMEGIKLIPTERPVTELSEEDLAGDEILVATRSPTTTATEESKVEDHSASLSPEKDSPFTRISHSSIDEEEPLPESTTEPLPTQSSTHSVSQEMTPETPTDVIHTYIATVAKEPVLSENAEDKDPTIIFQSTTISHPDVSEHLETLSSTTAPSFYQPTFKTINQIISG
ncbi:hypothetical protein QQF64_034842 [Cirrhinus molitorella]|uniref:SEA domain-containing protein n=1 Tax=Cirrhinus molitorella TaxID=172907 RepID=A0ABR3L1I7_9TELE